MLKYVFNKSVLETYRHLRRSGSFAFSNSARPRLTHSAATGSKCSFIVLAKTPRVSDKSEKHTGVIH